MDTRKRTLRQLREENDLTQAQIAELLGCSKNYYSMMERRVRKVPLEYAIKLASLYSVAVEDIDFSYPEVNSAITRLSAAREEQAATRSA